MTRATLEYLLRLAIQHRDEAARGMVESGIPSPAWGEAAAAVRELLTLRQRAANSPQRERKKMRVNTEMIPAEIAAECAEIGQTWAAQKFDLAQAEGRKRHDWTCGQYCGEYPGENKACEQMIDDAAIHAWEALWDARRPPDDGAGEEREMMKIKAYVYDEETMECLAVIGGIREDVEAEIAARFEQHGTPATFHPGGLVGVGSAEFIEVTR